MRSAMVLTGLVLLASTVAAQTPSTPSVVSSVRQQHRRIAGIVVRAAEKMPEEHFSFKPTPDVRSFAAMVGHIVDANHLLCRAAQENTFDIKREYELKPGTKAELIAALKKSIDYCETVFEATTDANALSPITTGGTNTQPRIMILNMNMAHSWEHYGNLVTYMRLKGIVPPTSEPPPAK